MKNILKILLITLVALMTNACHIADVEDFIVKEKSSTSDEVIKEQEEQARVKVITTQEAIAIANKIVGDLDSDMNKAWTDSFNQDGTVNEHSFTIKEGEPKPPSTEPTFVTENKVKGASGQIENYQTLVVAPYDKLYDFSGKLAKGLFHTHPYSV